MTQEEAASRGGRGGVGRVGRVVVLAVAGFVALQVVFFVLLTLGAAVPDGPIVQHLAHDVESGLYGPNGLPDRMGGKAGSFTECVVVGTGLGAPDVSPVRRAGEMPRLANCREGRGQIRTLAAGGQVSPSPYFRYWAGYTVVTRPVLALWGMAGLRLLSGALLVVALFAAVLSVSRQVGLLAASALFGPLVLATDVMSTPSTAFSQSLSIATYLGGAALCAWAAARSLGRAFAAVVVSAAVFCYVDLLTTPPAAWVLCAVIVGVVTFVRSLDTTRASVAVLGAGLLWPVSYAATWATRWLIAVPFLGWDAVREDVSAKVVQRTDGSSPDVSPALGAAVRSNVTYWLGHVATAEVVIWLWLAVTVVAVVVAFARGRGRALVVAILVLPVLVPTVWYEALSNHSQIHAHFTYQSLAIALGALAFVAIAVARYVPVARPHDSAAEEPAPRASVESAARV